MVTIEVNGNFMTWPQDFALTMMRYYRNHGVSFVIHRKCAHTGLNTTEEDVQHERGESTEPQKEPCRYM